MMYQTNIDKEIDEKYSEVYLLEESEESPLVSQLKKNIAKKFVEDTLDKDDRVTHEKGEEGDIRVTNRVDLLRALFPENNSIHGKHFAFSTPLGFETIIFRVFVHVDYEKKTERMVCERLVKAIDTDVNENFENNKRREVFFIDEPDRIEQLIILYINRIDRKVVMNYGEIEDDRLKISLSPITVRADNLCSRILRNETLFDVESIENVCRGNVNFYDADLQASTVIIDIDTAEPVRREVYRDADTNELHARIKIQTGKTYYSFKLKFMDEGYIRKLSDLRIGKNYRLGRYGFPEDSVEALRYLEKDGSPEALFNIALIFLKPGYGFDEEIGMRYLEKAVEKKHPAACVNLALRRYYDGEIGEAVSLLKQVSKLYYAPAEFVLGYLFEKGKGVRKNRKVSFSYYRKAAEKRFKPACLRLSGEVELADQSVRLSEIKTISSNSAYADYCFGCMQFFDDIPRWHENDLQRIEADKKNAFNVLLQSAIGGCRDAGLIVAYAYENGIGTELNNLEAQRWYGFTKNSDRSRKNQIKLEQEKAERKEMKTILILVALEKELRPILENIDSPLRKSKVETKNGRNYYIYSINDNITVLCSSFFGMGQVNSALAVKESLQLYDIDEVIMTGICAGLDKSKVDFGDIIISNQIINYEIAKVEDGEFKPRWEVYRGTSSLLKDISIHSSERWLSCLKRIYPNEMKSPPKVLVGDVITGNKIVSDSDMANSLKEQWHDALALEMESAGIAAALHQLEKAPAFTMVKAVCDFADSEKDDKWQDYAATSSALFTLDYLLNRTEVTSENTSGITGYTMGKSETQYRNQEELYDVLKSKFDMRELSALCFHMGISHEDVAGDTLETKVIGLIKYCERRDLIERLVNEIKRERPGVFGE